MGRNFWLGIICLTLTLFLSVPSEAQDDPDFPESLGRCLGIYQTEARDLYNELMNFERFELRGTPGQNTDHPKRDRKNRVFITGKIVMRDGAIFEFAKAFVTIVIIEDEEYYKGVQFTTAEVGHISYKFVGEFAEKIDQERSDGPFIKLRGKLTKFKNGRQVFSADIPFYEYAEM